MIVSPDTKGTIDPILHNIIRDIRADIPIVAVTRLDNFQFDERLYDLKEYVLFDYVENFWNWNRKETHLFGKNTDKFEYLFQGGEWMKFDAFVKANPPKKYFKRELLAKDQSDTVISSTYPCWHTGFKTQTREEFNSRRIDVFHYWGHSHESRRAFQGNAYLHAIKEDITIIDNIYYIGGFLAEKHKRYWATMHIPHFARIDIGEILQVNNNSKLSLSMPGAGTRCFRDSESPINSVMIREYDELAFPYSWEHGVNCILYKDNPIPYIEEALRRDDLYDIYLAGLETIEKYRIDNYLRNYIEPKINECL